MNRPNYQYTPLKGLGSILSTLLMLNILVLIASIGSDLMEINLLKRIVDMESVADSEIASNDARNVIVGIFVTVVELVLAIVFLKWIYRASANAHTYSSAGMTYSAGWSVGWFFVPIMNLFRPYQAMKETWQVSAAGPDDDPRFGVQVPSILPMWWALWIINSISSRVSFRLTMEAETNEDLLSADYVSIGDYALGICLTLAAIKVVRDLTRLQTERGEAVRGAVCEQCGEPVQTDSTSCSMCGAALSTASAGFDSNPFADPNPPADSNPFAT